MRFDPPTRITLERLHFKYLRWELLVEVGTCELRFDGNLVTILGGTAQIHGPCLYTLAENEPRVRSSNMHITVGCGPAPIGTQPTDSGFQVFWPLYCPINPTDNQLQITDLHGNRTLGLYTRKSFAEAACPDKFQILALSRNQVFKFVKDYGDRNLIDQVAFNPTNSFITTIQWPKFLKELEGGQNNLLQPTEEGEALAHDHDNSIQFPVYMFIKAGSQTPIHEIEVALIHDIDDLLPVFTKKEYAEAAKKVLVGDYKIKEFEKINFISFLRNVIFPRHIEMLTLNPDLVSEEERIQWILVANMITDLESDTNDQGIEKPID